MDKFLIDGNTSLTGEIEICGAKNSAVAILPAALLVNGSTGISAGYATDIPPHNIDEVMNAVIYRINHPNCSLDKLMEYNFIL